MDFIFEEDMDEVGSDIEAYCPKCKADTAHTVITKYEEEVRRVQCSTCGDVHAYRKPRGEVEEEQPEPVAAKKRAAAKKPTWQEAVTKAGNKAVGNARPYTIRDHYHDGDIVSHPKFGVGFVTEITENKAEVTFQDERRVLVHNRPDLAAQMPAIAPVPAPREEKVKGGKRSAGGGGAKKAAAVAGPAEPVATPIAPVAKAGGGGKSASTSSQQTQPIKLKADKPEKGEKPEKADKPEKAEKIEKAPEAKKPDAKSVEAKAVEAKAAKKPEPAKKPAVVAPVAKAVPAAVAPGAKAARAQAAAKKKGAAKGKPPAKPAARPAKPAASKPAARSVRPAARTARAEPPKGKLKKKAGTKGR